MPSDKQVNDGVVVSLSSRMDPDAGCNEMQAAIFLGVSVRTLQAWRLRGCGPSYIKAGRAIRYQRRALLTFQEERTVASASNTDAPAGARDGAPGESATARTVVIDQWSIGNKCYVQVSLVEYGGRWRVDLRVWFLDEDGLL